MKRRYYIDNLRWLCILLLIVYHTAMCYNCWGETNYIFFEENRALSCLIWFMSPWYMPLMMVLAGASSKLSLSRRGTKEFVKERICKLLIPLLLGILVAVEPIAYFADCYHNGYSGGYFEHYKVFFTRFTDLSGYDGGFTPGHLWFLLYLFVITIISLLIVKIPKINDVHKRISAPIFIMLGVLPLIVNPILNFSGKSVASYLIFYLIGYLFISDEDFVTEAVVKYRLLYLLLFAVSVSFNVYAGIKGLNGVMVTAVYYSASWFGVLTAIGFAKDYFNIANKMTRRLSKTSFVFYIFHYIWLTMFQFYIAQRTDSFMIILLVPMLLAYIATFITCEIFVIFKKIKSRNGLA